MGADSALDRLAADMDKHGIARVARYPASRRCFVQLHDGREGVAETFRDALRDAQSANASRWAA